MNALLEHFLNGVVAVAAGEDAFDEVNLFVRSHPLAVAAAAFALGFLVARAFWDWPTDMTRRMSRPEYQG